ncbi:hypothetical protein [Urbifossiella limnaea]|uniref:Uncharacterized protein n=1 Tax=Urbifossiella limnaea TaxID=2528023 RepID=A0A517XYQ2_9BACT|nr:hypothetical protein [Urbifossiella limnaea]QDU22588.1 hypothetical protein ETAA1_45710 [Urbifossiella limnaea]
MSADPPPPWWVLPNVAALDAPAVAAVWQRFLADRFGVDVPWAATAALAAAVWAVYLADRRLDARRGDPRSDRHRVAARSPRLFAAGAGLAAALALAFATQLPESYVLFGAGVGGGVAAYLAVVHAAAGGLGRLPGAKEFLVGVGFAAGVAVPLMAEGSPAAWPPAVAAFAALCWLNCRLIDRWESGARPTRADALLAAGVLVAATWPPPVVGGAVGAAVGALVVVHVAAGSAPRAARVLADVVLLTPLAAWGLA